MVKLLVDLHVCVVALRHEARAKLTVQERPKLQSDGACSSEPGDLAGVADEGQRVDGLWRLIRAVDDIPGVSRRTADDNLQMIIIFVTKK